MNETLSKFLDTSRWIAALCVLITHLNDRTFTVLAKIPASAHGPLLYLWVFAYGFAHQAVVVFFVLSGFLVGGAVLNRTRANTLDLSCYCIDRIVRIYLVLVPALVLTFIFDSIGHALTSEAFYKESFFAGSLSFSSFVFNLMNLQDIFVWWYGSDSPLWSLAHEFWNYMTFPLLCLPLMTRLSRGVRLGGFLAGLLLLGVTSIGGAWHLFGFGFAIWVAGALAILPTRPIVRSKTLALAIFLAASVGSRLYFRFSETNGTYIGDAVDVLIALTFANLILTMRFADTGWRFLNWRGHAALSRFSYSLYATHFPLVTLLCLLAQAHFGIGWRNVPSTPAHWVLAAAIFAAAVGFAWVFAQLTEARTAQVRGLVGQWVWQVQERVLRRPQPMPTAPT